MESPTQFSMRSQMEGPRSWLKTFKKRSWSASTLSMTSKMNLNSPSIRNLSSSKKQSSRLDRQLSCCQEELQWLSITLALSRHCMSRIYCQGLSQDRQLDLLLLLLYALDLMRRLLSSLNLQLSSSIALNSKRNH